VLLEDIDTKSNKKKRAFFIKCLSGSGQRPGLFAVLIPASYRGCVTHPYRTCAVFNLSIQLRYVRAGFSPVLSLSKNRKLMVYLPAGRQVPKVGYVRSDETAAE